MVRRLHPPKKSEIGLKWTPEVAFSLCGFDVHSLIHMLVLNERHSNQRFCDGKILVFYECGVNESIRVAGNGLISNCFSTVV